MIIVTGGAGFIGSAFVAFLNARGVTDIVVVDEATPSPRTRNLAHKRFTQFIGKEDFLRAVKEDTLPAGISAIVHLGASSSTTEMNRDYLRANNFEYSKELAEYCITRSIRYIYASSASTYGDGSHGYEDNEAAIDQLAPLNPYGESKQMMDLWARDTGALSKIVGLKFFNVYGPNEYYKGNQASVAWKAFNAITNTGTFSLFTSLRPEYKDGEQKRDFVYVKDCCEIMWWFLQNPTKNGIYNVGSGKARSWNDLLIAIFTAMKKPVNITYTDMPKELQSHYQYFTEAPMSKLRQAGFTQPMHTLEEGINDYVTNYLAKSDQHW